MAGTASVHCQATFLSQYSLRFHPAPCPLHRVCTVVFDKTGTLTAGKPHVVDIRALHDGLAVPDVLALAAAVEAHSEHPIASAILGLLARQQQLAAATPTAVDGQWGPDGKAPPNGYTNGGGSDGYAANGSSGSGGRFTPRLLQVRDVEVTVGQGISGWVQLRGPEAAAVAALERSSSGLSGVGSDGSEAQAALLGIQAAAAAGISPRLAGERSTLASAGMPPDGPHRSDGHAALASLLTTAAGSVAAGRTAGSVSKMAAPAEEVRVTVGNTRQMEAAGVAVLPAAEAFMRDQEGRGSTCVLVAVHQVWMGVGVRAGWRTWVWGEREIMVDRWAGLAATAGGVALGHYLCYGLVGGLRAGSAAPELRRNPVAVAARVACCPSNLYAHVA